jgi:hypothetical protein
MNKKILIITLIKLIYTKVLFCHNPDGWAKGAYYGSRIGLIASFIIFSYLVYKLIKNIKSKKIKKNYFIILRLILFLCISVGIFYGIWFLIFILNMHFNYW